MEKSTLINMPYIPGPGGFGPLYWGNDVTGILPAAVKAFYAEALGEKVALRWQVKLVRDYLDYYINAPCWDNNPHADAEYRVTFAALREEIKTLENVEGINQWIEQCIEIGIDPL
jgi:hypothetical protein